MRHSTHSPDTSSDSALQFPGPASGGRAAAPPWNWRRWWRKRRSWVLLSLALLAGTTVLTLLRPFPRIDHLLQDNARAAMAQRTSDEIVIVGIDQASIEALGPWPWRRSLHAELLQRIAAQSPRCIGLNLLLTDPSRSHAAEDAELARAMAGSGCVVLPVMHHARIGQPSQELVPTPPLVQAATALGHAELALGLDGVARSAYLREGYADRMWPHFVQALYSAGQGAVLPPQPPLPPPDDADGVPSPWLRSDHEIIVFAGEEQPFPHVSYIDVLRGEVPPALFRNRYVLVGATALGLGDAYATVAPGETVLRPAVDIFANLLQGMINGHRVLPASRLQDLAFNVLPLIVVLLAMPWLRPWAMVLLIGAMLATRLGLHVARPYVGVQFAPAVGFMALLVAYPAWIALRLTTALRYMRVTTAQINEELAGLPPAVAPSRRGDFLDRQIAATSVAAMRMRDMHRFVRDGIEYMPDPTLVLDDHACVLIVNRAALRHWHAEVNGLVGRDAHTLLGDLVSRRDGRPMVPPGTLLGPPEPRQGEGEDRDGRILLVRCVPFFDTRNTHAGWMVALVDITRMRQAQSQRDQALRFISHDIREPSAAILTILELVRSRPEQLSREEMLHRIERHARTGLELADGFVSVARAEVQPFEAAALDLVALLHQVADDAWVQARQRQVQVVVRGGPDEALCVGDRSLLARALRNVLSNAIKYSPPGCEVLCSVEERPGRPGRPGQPGQWALRVRDEGPGIAVELQPQLFQPFHRLHRDSHPEVPGVGLGLLLVRTVLHRHGGAVEIDSAANAGCTVSLVLPQPHPSELAALRADLE